MFCHKCGTQLPETSGFCHKCGTRIVRADAVQQTADTTTTTTEPKAVNIAEPPPTAPIMPVQTVIHILADDTDFKAFVDNHVRSTTKFQSADDLLRNSKPWMFLLPCFGIPTILGLFGGPIGMLVVGGFFGYVAAFVASGIIRMRYSGGFGGEFIGDINIEELISFLNGHLRQVHPDFHEWGYLTKKGLMPILENALANAMEEVRICSEFGPNKKSLAAFYIKPKTVDAKPGEMLYYVDALKNGFLVDGRAAGFFGHGTLIRTAPILQAAMKYYLKSKGGAE